MSEIKGGVVTVISEASTIHDVKFSSHGKLLLSVTRDGRLLIGDGIKSDAATKEVAEILVEHFGHSYGSALRAAEEKTAVAKAKTAAAERRVREWEMRASRAIAALETKSIKTNNVEGNSND